MTVETRIELPTMNPLLPSTSADTTVSRMSITHTIVCRREEVVTMI